MKGILFVVNYNMANKKVVVLLMMNLILAALIVAGQDEAGRKFSCDENSPNFNLSMCPMLWCKPFWECNEWSGCSNGIQTRSCFDEENCEGQNYKPQMIRNCTEQATTTNNVQEQKQQKLKEPETEPIATNVIILYAGLAAGIIVLALLVFFGYKKWSEKRAYSKLFEPEKTFENKLQTTTESSTGKGTFQSQQQPFEDRQQAFQTQQPVQQQAINQQANQQPELEAYIRQCLSAGYTKDQVKAALLKAGWAQEAVESELSRF